MLWHILRQSGASNGEYKHTNKLYIQTCNISSKLLLIPLCTLIHLYLALKPEQMFSFYICHNCTSCIMFTCIFMKTNKPHSDLNTLSKKQLNLCAFGNGKRAAVSPLNQHAAGMFLLWSVEAAAGSFRKCYFFSWFGVSS